MDCIISYQFVATIVECCRRCWVEICPFLYCFAVGFYNNLYYSTSRDFCKFWVAHSVFGMGEARDIKYSKY